MSLDNATASAILDWLAFFEVHNVQRRDPAFSLPSADKPTMKEVEESETEIGFKFPQDYVNFCLEVGPGLLGSCHVVVPYYNYSSVDIRYHHLRHQQKFKCEEYKTRHKFPMLELVGFSVDKEEGFWFGWRKDLKDDQSVFCFDENDDQTPPLKVARDFSDFVRKFAFGNSLKRLGLKKQVHHEQDSEVSSDEDEGEDEQSFVPDYIFRPSPAPPRLS